LRRILVEALECIENGFLAFEGVADGQVLDQRDAALRLASGSSFRLPNGVRLAKREANLSASEVMV